MKKRKLAGWTVDGSTIHGIDGVFMGGGDGAVWQVFAPRWFELWRWLRWWTARGMVKATVELMFGGERATVRIFRTERTLPRVPSSRAVQQNGNEGFDDATTK